jgi:integrase
MRAKLDRECLRKAEDRAANDPKAVTYDILDTDDRGFLARVTPKGVISFGIRYSDANGKQCRLSLGMTFPNTTVSAARAAAKTKLAEIELGIEVARNDAGKKHKGLTLDQFISDHYSDWLIANTKSGKLRAAAIRAAFPALLTKPLTDITAIMIEKWRTERMKGGISASTTNRNITALRGLLSRALDWDLIPKHPLASVKMLQEPSGKVRWLSADEEARLRAALDAREERDRAGRDTANQWREKRKYDLLPDLREAPFVDHLKPMVLVSINTGLRQGELFNLEWPVIDFANAIVTIKGENAKSGEDRHIPLNDEALATLTQWRAQTAGALVFPGPTGAAITEIKTAWSKLLKDAKIEGFRWHDMRHHFASRLVMAGVDLNTVRELLGHADIKMTLRYAHLAPEHKAAAVQKLIRQS